LYRISADIRRRPESGRSVRITEAITQLTRDCVQPVQLITVNKINTTESCDVPA